MNIDDRRPTSRIGKFQMAVTLQRVTRSTSCMYGHYAMPSDTAVDTECIETNIVLKYVPPLRYYILMIYGNSRIYCDCLAPGERWRIVLGWTSNKIIVGA